MELDIYLSGSRSKSGKGNPSLTFEPYGEQPRQLSASEAEEAKTISGTFEEPLGPRRDYQDCLRVAFFRDRGEADETIAVRLKVPPAWVSSCGSPFELPVPKQVPKYIAEHGLRCLQGSVEPFRPAELRRAFVKSCDSTFEAIHKSLNWEAAPALKRDYSTGEVVDTGHRLLRERASCGLVLGVPSVDEAIAEIVKDYSIDDPGAYLLCNYYKDGRAFIAPHQHDFWSATFSFGEPRIFLLDQNPLLLCDGDVLIFGSQRHSVPKMPNLKKERISLSLFWYPNWKSDMEYTDEQLERWDWQRKEEVAWARRRADSVDLLSNFGFPEGVAVVALNDVSDDVNAAAEALLQGKIKLEKGIASQCMNKHIQSEFERPAVEAGTSPKVKGRWRHKRQ